MNIVNRPKPPKAINLKNKGMPIKLDKLIKKINKKGSFNEIKEDNNDSVSIL